ncbi:uncharacterized protein METZ01_LOCUS296797, partial [marine metagenome]
IWLTTYQPNLNFYGTDEFMFTVENSGNNNGPSDPAVVSIVINPINDAPALTPINDQLVDEDQQLTVPITYTDYDGDTLSVTLTSSNENVSVSLDNSTITITPFLNFNGSAIVTVTVNESAGEYQTSGSFDVTVNAVNDAPELTSIPDQVMIEDEILTINLSATDIDGDENFVFSAVSDNDSVDVSIDGNTLTMTPALNINGTANITVSVSDNELTDSQALLLTIEPVPDAPELTSIANTSTAEDTPLVLTLEATDVDGDDLIFSTVSGDSNNVEAEVTGDQLTLTPAPDWNGSVNISVSVSDDEFTDSDIFELTVTPVNDVPTIVLPDSRTFAEDGNLSEDFSGYLSDIDEDDLTLSVSDNENITVSINGFSVTLGTVQDWNGTETLTF